MTIEVHNPPLLIQEKEFQKKKNKRRAKPNCIKIKTKVE